MATNFNLKKKSNINNSNNKYSTILFDVFSATSRLRSIQSILFLFLNVLALVVW